MLRRDHRVVAWTLLATASVAVVPVFAAGALRAAPAPVADGVADAPVAVVDETASPSPSPTPSESPTPTPSEEPAPSQPPATTPAPPTEPQPTDPAPTGDPTGPVSPSATASTSATATPTEQPTSTPTPSEPVPTTIDGLTFSYDVTDGVAGPTGTCSVTAEAPAPASADASVAAGSDQAASTADTGATTTPVAISCLSVTKYQRTGSQVRFSGDATQGGKPTSYSITVIDGRGARADSFRIETGSGFVGGGALTGGSLKVR